jgi:murein DD-endopeptidase MepM/ murein hydrolase activator NlpD
LVYAYLALAVMGCATTTPASPTEVVRIAPASLPPRADGQPSDLRLPVDGTWLVIQGYSSADSHRGYAAYALDFVKLDDRGRAHARSGRRLQDWYGFGADVLASADGVVVRAIDHIPDNPLLGKRRDTNSIIVRHGEVFSEYVHLRQRSLRVRVGDRVKRGDVIARVGNSGCETPHLHWALLSSIDPIQTRPANFVRYELRDIVGAWRATSGVPRFKDIIRHLP